MKILILSCNTGEGHNSSVKALQTALKRRGVECDIEKLFPGSNKVKALGYTRKVSLLMDASDMLMTKPGGITSTEAIIKNIPLVHIDPIKGLEEDNAAFFHKSGMALGGEDIAGQVAQAGCLYILNPGCQDLQLSLYFTFCISSSEQEGGRILQRLQPRRLRQE